MCFLHGVCVYLKAVFLPDPNGDPFLSMKKGKQERIAKNKSNQLRNLKLASGKANSVHPMIGKAPVLR
jgi:hypothetical protein